MASIKRSLVGLCVLFALPQIMPAAGCRFAFSPSNVNSTQLVDHYVYDGTGGPWPYSHTTTIGTLQVEIRPVDADTGAYDPNCQITGLAFSQTTNILATRNGYGPYYETYTFNRPYSPPPTWLGETYHNYQGYALIGYQGVDLRTGAGFSGSFDFQLVGNATTGI